MAKEVKCPTCSFKFNLSNPALFFRWFCNFDRDSFVADFCPSTYCRGNRR